MVTEGGGGGGQGLFVNIGGGLKKNSIDYLQPPWHNYLARRSNIGDWPTLLCGVCQHFFSVEGNSKNNKKKEWCFLGVDCFPYMSINSLWLVTSAKQAFSTWSVSWSPDRSEQRQRLQALIICWTAVLLTPGHLHVTPPPPTHNHTPCLLLLGRDENWSKHSLTSHSGNGLQNHAFFVKRCAGDITNQPQKGIIHLWLQGDIYYIRARNTTCPHAWDKWQSWRTPQIINSLARLASS